MNLATLALGTDLVEVDRIESAVERTPGFIDRVFTHAEIEYCRSGMNASERFAARWAAKESVLKALGLGLGGASFTDIEIMNDASGAPSVTLVGAAKEAADERRITGWLVSMSHTSTMAQAVVIGLG